MTLLNKIMLNSKFKSCAVLFKKKPFQYKRNWQKITMQLFKSYHKRGKSKRLFNSNLNI